MAATDALAYPMPNTAYRVYFNIKSLATGSPITGGLTGMAAQLMKDGAPFVASTNAPVEVNGSGGSGSGYGYLDITATEMNYSAVVVRIAATNPNAVEWQIELITDGVAQAQSGLATSSGLVSTQSALATDISNAGTAILAAMPSVTTIWNQADYGDAAGRATTVLAQIAQIWRYLFNAQTVDKNAQTQTLSRDNGTATLVQGSITVNSTLTQKGKMQ